MTCRCRPPARVATSLTTAGPRRPANRGQWTHGPTGIWLANTEITCYLELREQAVLFLAVISVPANHWPVQIMSFRTLDLKQIFSHKFRTDLCPCSVTITQLAAQYFSMFPACTSDCVWLCFSRYLLVSAQVGLHPEYLRSLRYLASADTTGRTLVLSECAGDPEQLCDGGTLYNYWTTLQVRIQGSCWECSDNDL